MMADAVAREQQTDNKIKVMNIINDLVTGPKENVQKEAVLIESQAEGLTERQTEQIIEELKDDNFLVEKAGYLRKIQ